MGLEERNGRLYYYSKQRTGDKVVSVYEGSGDVARLYALHAEEQREHQEAGRAIIDQDADDFDRLLDETLATGKTALKALYIANGYHTHSRSWRRKRQ